MYSFLIQSGPYNGPLYKFPCYRVRLLTAFLSTTTLFDFLTDT